MAINIKKPKTTEETQDMSGPVGQTMPVNGEVTIHHKDGSEVTTSEVVEVPAVMTPNPALVEVAIGLTRNLGNFESIKINVGIRIPCEVDEDEINATYATAKEWVDTKINEFNDELNKSLV